MALVLDGVRIAQGGFHVAADLAVQPAQRVAIMGASGAGKSTLLHAIAGFVPLAAGRITWDGVDLGPRDPGARPISLLFQDNNLFPHLTVAQNVGLGLRPDLRLRAEDTERVTAALTHVGLDGFADRLPGALSGGEASRAALARVLLRARPLVLLDEPFAALGPGLRAEMLDLVARLVAEIGATLLMVTHDPRDAQRIADQVIFLAAGQAAAPVATDALFADPPPAVRAYLGSA